MFNIIIYGICFSSLALSQETENQSLPILIHNYRNGVVHVGQLQDETETKNIKWLGTAFLVDESCTFATAKHIFNNANREKLVIRFQLPSDLSKVRTLRARVLYEDSKSDIAFLKIDSFNNQPCNSKNLYSFPLLVEMAKDSLVGEAIFIIGYPMLSSDQNIDYPAVRQGIISSTNIKFSSGPMILLDLFGVPGFSGSPVILEKTGQAIGVIFGPGPTKRNYGFEWATPICQGDYLKATETANKK
jgi:S1-C subfamily serine protease